MARRRKEERRVGIASRGMVRQLGRFTARVRHRVVPDRDRVPDRCNTSGVSHLLHMEFFTGLCGSIMPTMIRAPHTVTLTPPAEAVCRLP